MNIRAYDKPLVYNLSLVDDWAVFGTFKFNTYRNNDHCLRIWYDFIRQVERRNQGQWLAKLEGSNTWRSAQKHIHYLIAKKGTKNEWKNSNIVNSINSITCLMSVKNSAYRYDMEKGSHKVEAYNSEQGAKHYISKMCFNDTLNLDAKGLDNAEHCCWKMSHKLKQRIRKLNENNEKPCYH